MSAAAFASSPIGTTQTSNGEIACGHTMPRSSENCSTADARMRAGPMPYEPIQTGCSFPASSTNMAPIGSEYRVPSLKMLPTSIIGSMRSVPPQWTHVSPASACRMSATRAVKSRPCSALRRW